MNSPHNDMQEERRPSRTTDGISWLFRILLCLGGLKVGLALFLSLVTGVNVGEAGPSDERPEQASQVSQAQSTASTDAVFSQQPLNPEIIAILQAEQKKLAEERQKLAQKNQEMDVMAKELENRLSQLNELKNQLEGPAKQAKAAEKEGFEQLVAVYGSMEDSKAAALLSNMDDATVVRILKSMKGKKVAAILSLMEPQKAARLSTELAKNRP